MGISEIQQALRSVALKGSLDTFRTQTGTDSSGLLPATVNATTVPTNKNGLQLTLF
ncbi:MAG: hypothetical protein OEQ81_04810 [Flavobacteriaceae bacterium]|nr:hypothetical protein [Flavobacteriaceae bacterium]